VKVTYIQHCGSDLMVANAARVSFDKKHDEFDEDKDTRLIRYLARHGHTSPFNHTFITLHVKAPVFVARQLVKHRFMIWNEVSRRYVSERPEFYYPEVWRMAAEDKKQGSSEVAFDIDKSYREKYGTRPDQSITNRKLTNWRNGAKRKGVEFDLEYDDIPWVTHCPILGVKLDYDRKGHGNNGPDSPSLDRINNEKGYVKGNVQVISRLANTMKNSATPEQIRQFCLNMLPRYGVFNSGSDTVEDYCEGVADTYERLIKEGLCPEQARGILPLNHYTQWFWSGTLGAWASMYNLRAKPDAQAETRMIAEQAGEIIEPLFPVSWGALTKGDV